MGVRGTNRFRQNEVKRLVSAVQATGLGVARIECDAASGRISVIPGEPAETSTKNDWDKVLPNAKKRPA